LRRRQERPSAHFGRVGQDLTARVAKKKRSARAERRALARSGVKLARDLERLWLLQPGGSAERPIDLASASQVEITARAMPCPVCEGALQVEEHAALTVGAARLRVARVVCQGCGARRDIYFRLGASLPS
jgi:hypothetical protein